MKIKDEWQTTSRELSCKAAMHVYVAKEEIISKGPIVRVLFSCSVRLKALIESKNWTC
jgi:hypothetical protein